MSDVVITGAGQVPVGEHWDKSLRTLAHSAIMAALADSPDLKPDALYIGNFLGSMISHQSNLGSLVVTNSGLEHIESYTVEAAGASGAAALRQAYLAVKSGYVDVALAVGVEKVTDKANPVVEEFVIQGGDYDYEGLAGLSATAQAALLMQRYMHEYRVGHEVFADFPIIAHKNAVNNANALYRRVIDRDTYLKAQDVSSPLNHYDVSPYADGAAAVLLTRTDHLKNVKNIKAVRIAGSSVVVDTLALHDRKDPLAFHAANISMGRACNQAGIHPHEVDLFELDDAFSIYSVLSLEAAGLAKRGEGWKLARDGKLDIEGELPVCTMGGSKARGNPLGATGLYQVVEAVQQLRGQAGDNQVKDAGRALVQSLGGPASTAITHVLMA